MKLKKIFASLAMIGLLLGGTITCYASGPSDHHTHIYTVHFEDAFCYESVLGVSHPYIKGYEIHPVTGVKTPIYSTCQVIVYKYRAPYKCDICGEASGNYYEFVEEVHQNCGH